MVDEEGGLTLEGELQTPNIRSRLFYTYEDLIGFCNYIEPNEASFRRIDVELWQLQYIEGDNDE